MKKFYLIIFLFVFNLGLTYVGCSLYKSRGQLEAQVNKLARIDEVEKKHLKKNEKYRACMRTNKIEEQLERLLDDVLLRVKREESDRPKLMKDLEGKKAISAREIYLSGFAVNDDCIRVLEILSEVQLPLWITSISLHRNILHNNALQVSITYKCVR